VATIYDATMAGVRSQINTFLMDLCIIYRKTGDTLVNGIAKPQYDAGTLTPCRFIRSQSSELQGSSNAPQAKTIMQSTPSFLFSAATAAIGQADYITYAGRSYNVIDASQVSALDGQLELSVQLRT